MATDLEKLRTLFKEFGMTEDENPIDEDQVAEGKDFMVCGLIKTSDAQNSKWPEGGSYLTINQGEGYAGFGASFVFNKDGKFVSHAVWE